MLASEQEARCFRTDELDPSCGSRAIIKLTFLLERKLAFRVENAGIRAVFYDGDDTLSRRIVAAHEMAVPVMAIVGAREMREGRVSLRERNGSQLDMPLAEAVLHLKARTRPDTLCS
jgi:threonyl-tRNA synthetase